MCFTSGLESQAESTSQPFGVTHTHMAGAGEGASAEEKCWRSTFRQTGTLGPVCGFCEIWNFICRSGVGSSRAKREGAEEEVAAW